MLKSKTLKQQRLDGELGLIIDEFGRAMWNANRAVIARPSECQHDKGINFTIAMEFAWSKYVNFCRENPQ